MRSKFLAAAIKLALVLVVCGLIFYLVTLLRSDLLSAVVGAALGVCVIASCAAVAAQVCVYLINKLIDLVQWVLK